MKTKISARATKVLTRIAGDLADSDHCILSIGRSYKIFARTRASFRAAAGCIDGGVPIEVFPGFEGGGSIGIDTRGGAWIAFQDEFSDASFPLGQAKLKGVNRLMASHVVALIEAKLLALTVVQIEELSRAMRKVHDAGYSRTPF